MNYLHKNQPETILLQVVYQPPVEKTISPQAPAQKNAVQHTSTHNIFVAQVTIPAGQTVQYAITKSGLLRAHPHVRLDLNRTGIYGAFVPLQHVPQNGDRIEVYEPVNKHTRTLHKKPAAK